MEAKFGDLILSRTDFREYIKYRLRNAHYPLGGWKPMIKWHLPSGRNVLSVATYSASGYLVLFVWLFRMQWSCRLINRPDGR